MFTGMIEEMGTVDNVSPSQGGLKLGIRAGRIMDDLGLGDSISVNGVCLTVSQLLGDSFAVDVITESVERSNLSRLGVSDKVNLERAMRQDGRFGGHIVSGHIDGVGRISSSQRRGNSVELKIDCPVTLMKYVIEKGSVAVDGISLTVSGVLSASFKISVIPFTIKKTSLVSKRPGDEVNIEVDLLGKYVEKQLSSRVRPGSRIDEKFLSDAGFLS